MNALEGAEFTEDEVECAQQMRDIVSALHLTYDTLIYSPETLLRCSTGLKVHTICHHLCTVTSECCRLAMARCGLDSQFNTTSSQVLSSLLEAMSSESNSWRLKARGFWSVDHHRYLTVTSEESCGCRGALLSLSAAQASLVEPLWKPQPHSIHQRTSL